MTIKQINALRQQAALDNFVAGSKCVISAYFDEVAWEHIYARLQASKMTFSQYFKALLRKYKVFTELDELIVPLQQRSIKMDSYVPTYKVKSGYHSVYLSSYHIKNLKDRLNKRGFKSPRDLLLRGKL